MTEVGQHKDFVTDDKLVRELGLNYVYPCSQLTFEADKRIAKEQIVERKKMPPAGMLKTFCHYDKSLHIHYNCIL